MTDERLLNGEATDLEAALLQSATNEAPSAELSAKMMAPIAGATAAAAATGSSAMKWVAGLIAGALLAGGAAFSLRTQEPVAPVETPRTKEPETASDLPPPVTEDAPAEKEASSDSSPEPAPQAKPTPRRDLPASSSPSQLSQEMQLLDVARHAVRQDESKRALKVLNTYARKYPNGRLREEATVLRVKALKASGASKKASELQKDFLRNHPQSAHKKQLDAGQDTPVEEK